IRTRIAEEIVLEIDTQAVVFTDWSTQFERDACAFGFDLRARRAPSSRLAWHWKARRDKLVRIAIIRIVTDDIKSGAATEPDNGVSTRNRQKTLQRRVDGSVVNAWRRPLIIEKRVAVVGLRL